jgi:hypothetical protein
MDSVSAFSFNRCDDIAGNKVFGRACQRVALPCLFNLLRGDMQNKDKKE